VSLKIRLRRTGATKQPSYRVVVAEARSPRDGKFVEVIGHYNPLTEPATIKIDQSKVDAWMSRGARPTEIVARLLQKVGPAAAGTAGPRTTGTPDQAEVKVEGSDQN